MTALRFVAGLLVLAVGCTGSPTTSTPPATSAAPTGTPTGCLPGDPECPLAVDAGALTYEVECRPVAEALVDVRLPGAPGQPKVHAITGVALVQAIAVRWDEPAGCGVWALALAQGVPGDVRQSIRDEMARGVERFGVIASPVPKELVGD